MRVIVVGAGIGGLAAAVALRRAGHETLVLERAPRLQPVGAGITLFANAMHALGRLGVADAVAARGAPARRSAIMTARGGQLAELPADLLEGAVAVHRADLLTALADAAGELRFGVEVTGVQQHRDTAVAAAADGAQEPGDLVIGADGIHSQVRSAIVQAQPRYAGYTSWRGISPVAVDAGRFSESWGSGERFGLVDIGGGRSYWFATKNAPEGQADEAGGRKAEVMRRFAEWHQPIAAVAGATDEDAILRNDVYYLEPLARWSNGRVLLLGDAAHATTPGVGQGAAQAIEDAVVLADSLADGRDLAASFSAYESLRRPRTTRVLKVSRRADRTAQLASPIGRRLRNAVVRALPAGAQRRQLEPLVAHRV